MEPVGGGPDLLVAADLEFATEQRRKEHVEAQLARLVCEVDPGARLPAATPAADHLDHTLRVVGEAVAGEKRLEGLPLSPPRLPLDGDESALERDAEVVRFAEVLAVVQQKTLEVVRVTQMVDVARPEKFDPDEVAVGHRPVAEAEHVAHRSDGVENRVPDGVGVRREGWGGVRRRRSPGCRLVRHTCPIPIRTLIIPGGGVAGTDRNLKLLVAPVGRTGQ